MYDADGVDLLAYKEIRMSRHETAVGMIESRLDAMNAGDSSVQIHSEASAYTEMAYALGAIDCNEHSHYVARRYGIYQVQSETLATNMRRFA